MDRLTFLRGMLGSTALLTLPPLEILPEPEQDMLSWTDDCHQLFLYDCHVRGFSHHKGPRLLLKMKEGDILDLVREYGNEHDDSAVAVYWDGQKIGYLPMQENVVLANLIDYGMRLESHIVYTDPDAEPWAQCFIAVELLVPAHPAFDRYIDHYFDRPDAGYKLRKDYKPEEQEQLALARQHLTDAQLIAWLQAVEVWPEKRPPDVITKVLSQLKSGCSLEQLFASNSSLELHVRPAGRMKVISLTPRENGYGGEWRAEFADETVKIKGFTNVYVE